MCVKPLKGWIIGKTAEGKKQIKITSFEVDHLERYVTGELVSVGEFGNVNHVASFRPTGSQLEVQRYDEYITIPCGHCIECLKDRGQQWTNRCMLEYISYLEEQKTYFVPSNVLGDGCYFVTLTYDDVHLPVTYYSDPDTGEAFPAYELRKSDVQKFLKRCRKRFYGNEKGNLRYYIAGEYGPTTLRPHYHCILFGLPLDDLVQSDNPNFYNSAMMAELWPFGFHQISPLEPNMIAYTCHYVTGKLNQDNYDLFDAHNMQRPFNIQSCKPALGRRFYDMHPEIAANMDNPSYRLALSFEDKGYNIPIPKYFQYLYECEGGDLSVRKNHAKDKAAHNLDFALASSNLTYPEQLEAKERNALNQYANMLRRDKL